MQDRCAERVGSVLGLDLSDRGAGLVTLDGATGSVWAAETVGYALKRTATTRERVERMLDIATAVVRAYRVAPAPCGVAIEQFAWGARGAQNDLGELHGVVKTQLWLACRVEPALYIVSQIRKEIFGKGNLKKDKILPHVVQLGVPVADHNQADAWAVAALHLHRLTGGAVDVGSYEWKQEKLF
jgi:Holliday junction resolvasome RuvABC endonuclease subunit